MLKSVASFELAFGVVVLLYFLVLALLGASGRGGPVVGWVGVRVRVRLGANADSIEAGVPAIGLVVGVAGDGGLDCVLVMRVDAGMVFGPPHNSLDRGV